MHTKRRTGRGGFYSAKVVAPLVARRPSHLSIFDGNSLRGHSMWLACHVSAGRRVDDHDSCQHDAQTNAGDPT